MKIILIVFSGYIVYFVGQIIFDAFFAKPKIRKGENSMKNNIILQDHEVMPEPEQPTTVNFGFNPNEDKIVEESSNKDLHAELDLVQDDTIPDRNQLESDSFISKFENLIESSSQVISAELVDNNADILEILQNSTKITSFDRNSRFSYS